MKRTVIWMVAAIAWWWWTAGALASPVYQYVFGQDQYTVSPGGTVDVAVYLVETAGPGETPVLAPGGAGLLTAGVQVVFGDPPQPSQPAQVLAGSDIAANPAFDEVSRSVTPTSAGLALVAFSNPEVYGEEQSAGVYRVLLGTFHFTAGQAPSEATVLRAMDYDPGFADIVTGDMRVLDSGLREGTATITTVPEPGTMGLLAAGAACGLAGLWRRRRTRGHKAPASSKPWAASPWHRRLALERLEDRSLLSLATVASTMPGLEVGMLDAETQFLEIRFAQAVLGAATASNYELRAAGPDGLLRTVDDPVLPVSVVYSGTAAVLSVPPLAEDVYCLTVREAITDTAGNRLDGDGDGVAGGDWVRDFIVTPSPRLFSGTLTCPSGGRGSRAVAVGDFTGDGRSDLAVTNYDSNNLSVLLGNGKGGFATATTIATGATSPSSAAVGDFNHDGKWDLAVAHGSGRTIGILLGDGRGGFSAATTFSTGGASSTSAQGVAIADVNGDGKSDVVVGNQGGNVGVLLGDGNGGLAPVATFPTSGGYARSVAIGDLNGDGLPDLAVANVNYGTVSVLLNIGPGGFAAPAVFPSGAVSVYSLQICDLNGDGKNDVAAGLFNDSVGVLLGDGKGGLGNASTTYVGGSSGYDVVVEDFNNDGLADIASSGNGGVVGVVLGTGGGAMGPAAAFGSGGSGPHDLALGDFNGDGRRDLVAVNHWSNNIGVLLGNGGGSFAAITPFSTGGSGPYCVAAGDFNGDGKNDLAVANSTSDNVGVLLSNGLGSFAAPTAYSSGGSDPRSVAVGDFNRDGKSDLAVANYDSGTVAILQGNGNGSFAAAKAFSTGGTGPWSITVADFNRDGASDLAVANNTDGSVGILLGNGTGRFPSATTFQSGLAEPRCIVAGDFNGDGKPDLALARGDSRVAVLLGNGAGSFAAPTLVSSGTGGAFGIAPGDFNGDGKTDLAVGNSSVSAVGVLISNGSGPFAPVKTFSSGGGFVFAVAVGDFNGDGKADIAAAHDDGGVGVLLGDGSGLFASPSTFSGVGGYQIISMVASDFSGDDKSDLAMSCYFRPSAALLSNIFGPPPVTLFSPGGMPFEIATGNFGPGQLLQGSANAFDGDGRLLVGGKPYRPGILTSTMSDGGRTVITSAGTVAGLAVARKVTVPAIGSQEFARTVDTFTNPTGSSITTTVTVVGNLGADAMTVFATSDGTGAPSPNDQWIGTDDADGTGSPAVIHYMHGPRGLRPSSVNVMGDNIQWTYNLTVPAGQTVRLASLTIVATMRAAAIAAADALVTAESFGGQAGIYLSPEELASLSNFQFDHAPVARPGGPYLVVSGQDLRLDASGSSDPDSGDSIVSYQWDVGADGSYEYSGISPIPSWAQLSGLPANTDIPLRLTVTDGFGLIGSALTVLRVVALPTVLSIAANDITPQRSMVTSLVVTFNTAIACDHGAFEIVRLGGGAVDVTVSASTAGGYALATLTFTGSQTEHGSLVDGNYRLTIRGDKIHDATYGIALDGDGDGQPGGDYVLGEDPLDAFFRLFGDSDGDRDVDNLDFARLRGTYNKTSSDPSYLGYFNFDADGDVDSADLAAFKLRYLTRLESPAIASATLLPSSGLVKTDPGTLVLSGTREYTGGTTVLAGILEVASPTALPAGGSLTIGSGGTVVLASGLSAFGTADSGAVAIAAALAEPEHSQERMLETCPDTIAATLTEMWPTVDLPAMTLAETAVDASLAVGPASGHDAVPQASNQESFADQLVWLWESEQSGFARASKKTSDSSPVVVDRVMATAWC